MVKLGDTITSDVIREVANQSAPDMTVTLTAKGRVNLGTWFEVHGFHRAIAGDEDFDRVLDAFHLCAKLNRGIIFIGENGCGKTQAMRAIWQFVHAHVDSDWINCVNRDNVEWLCLPSSFMNQNIYLDDLGAERMQYGDEDIVGTFICSWYQQNPKRKLFITTNLNSTDINNRYGGRVLDRIKDRCVVCAFKGQSKRQEIVA